MMSEQLSAFRIKRGRKIFDSYSAINSFSFALVTGNSITLYALALNASSTVIGLLGAFMYLSFFAIPIGKMLVRKASLVRVFASSWMMRNWSLIPLLAIPYLASAGFNRLAITLLLAGVFLFNLCRGIGLIANNPVISMLAPGKDRGEYIIKLSLINNSTALVATILLAWLLWHKAGVETYNLVVLLGILTGIAASALLYKLPDPGTHRDTDALRPGSFFSAIRDASREPNFLRFVASYVVLGIGIGMARPFIIVFCKEVYSQADSIVTVFTMCSTLGALLMGAVMRLVIDRLGAKPMYIIFAAVSLLSLVPALIAPGVGVPGFAFLFLCILSAVTNMGFAGQESAAQTYFFAMVKKESIVDLSMLYFFIIGTTGALGSIAGGAILDFFAGLGLSPLASFRLFFSASILVILAGIPLQKRLLDLGSFPVFDTLAVLFSPRDMRALTLLKKLDANEDPDEETGIIAELGEVASPVSAEVLLDRLSSVRYAVRYEALQSVSSLKRLNGKVREALIGELERGEFSTASIAARLLGQFKVHHGAERLRASLHSADYRLVGEAMLALARLGDPHDQFLISEAMFKNPNPFVLVRGVQAMEAYGTAATIPILLDLLRQENLPEHIANETILVLAGCMGVPRKFVYAFERYVRDKKKGLLILEDALEECFSRVKRCDTSLKDTLERFLEDPEQDDAFVQWILGIGKGHTGVHSALLVSVALDTDLNRQESFRFFLCFWAVSIFMNPRLIEK